MNWRKLAVCTVGLVLALLLGGALKISQIPPSAADPSAVYAAEKFSACFGSGSVAIGEEWPIKCRIKCGPTKDGFGCWIECVF